MPKFKLFISISSWTLIRYFIPWLRDSSKNELICIYIYSRLFFPFFSIPDSGIPCCTARACPWGCRFRSGADLPTTWTPSRSSPPAPAELPVLARVLWNLPGTLRTLPSLPWPAARTPWPSPSSTRSPLPGWKTLELLPSSFLRELCSFQHKIFEQTLWHFFRRTYSAIISLKMCWK